MRELRTIMMSLAILLFVTPPARAEWEASDTELAAALTMHALDAIQTRNISESCHTGGRFTETNPVLGACPSKTAVTGYFIGTAALLTAAHYLLPPSYAKWSTRLWLAVEVGAVGNNVAVGVKLAF